MHELFCIFIFSHSNIIYMIFLNYLKYPLIMFQYPLNFLFLTLFNLNQLDLSILTVVKKSLRSFIQKGLKFKLVFVKIKIL